MPDLLFVIQCPIHVSGENQQPFMSGLAINYSMHAAVKLRSHTCPHLSSQLSFLLSTYCPILK